MTGAPFRLLLALAAFVGVAALGLSLAGVSLDTATTAPTGDPPFPGSERDPFALVMAVAMGAALLVYAIVERRQTGERWSLSRSLGHRTWVLLPIAVALDIGLGAGSANGLGLPLPMESVGTILIAALCGPFAGALAAFISLTLWGTLVPAPYGLPSAAAFAVVGVLTGLVLGAIAGTGALRPRPRQRLRTLIPAIALLAAAMAVVAVEAWLLLADVPVIPVLDQDAEGPLLLLGWLVAFVVVGGAVAGLGRLLLARDTGVVLVAIFGLLLGAITALARTPIVAGVLDGTTGFGFDPWVAAVTSSAGDPWLSTLRTLLLFEPVDRMLTLLGVYVVIVSIGVASRSGWPQGEAFIAEDDDFALRVGTSLGARRR